jgi:cobalt-zinc-cadmium efflux system membrane fusion protein
MALVLSDCGTSTSSSTGDAVMFTDDHGLLTVPEASPLRSHLEIQPVIAGGKTLTLELPATVEADPARTVNILAPLMGRVVSLKVGLGDRVVQDQVLAQLVSGDLALAYSDEDKAQDALELAKKSLDRARGVHEAGGSADKDLEAAQSAVNQAQAEATRAHARLQSLNGVVAGRGRELLLTAPQSGVVTALALATGAQVSDPTATLMTVTNLDHVFLTANVAEGDIGKITLGTEAEIVLTAYPTQPLHAKVTEVNALVEPDTRRQKVRIDLANDDRRLMPNMYATVRIIIPAMGAVIVPQSALLMKNDAVSVMVEVKPWVFQRRTLHIADETETSASVLSGLEAGDRVVVKGGILLND